MAGFTGPFSYDGSFRRMWMTWRRNLAGSYILPVNFYTYIDISGTDKTQWKILKVFILSLSCLFINHISHSLETQYSSCIMTKYSHLSHPLLKHSTTVPLSGTPSRPILKQTIPGLKDIVEHTIATLTIFLDLDLFLSLGYDTELIVRDNTLVGWDGECILAITEIWG